MLRRSVRTGTAFFEHFVHIADAINTTGGTGLWNEQDGFYYDQMYVDGRRGLDGHCRWISERRLRFLKLSVT